MPNIIIMTINDLRRITETGAWGTRARDFLGGPRPNVGLSVVFSTYWVEAGHRIREQVADDRLLVRLLRYMLQPYEGDAATLFRGESLERWEADEVGLAWTASIDIGRMFGRGLNSIPTAGVLLQGHFEPATIISGPNAHSRYLGEEQYTIDPFLVRDIVVVETFPCVDAS